MPSPDSSQSGDAWLRAVEAEVEKRYAPLIAENGMLRAEVERLTALTEQRSGGYRCSRCGIDTGPVCHQCGRETSIA